MPRSGARCGASWPGTELSALCPRRHIPRTSDGRADRPSPHILLEAPLPEQPHCPKQVWAGDITFIPTENGWLYLAVVLDLCTRKVVGWSISIKYSHFCDVMNGKHDPK